MEKSRYSKLLLSLAILVAISISSPLAYYLTKSIILSVVGFLGTFFISIAFVRYVLIEPRQSEHVAAISIFKYAIFTATTIGISQHPIVLSFIMRALSAIDLTIDPQILLLNPWFSYALSIIIIVGALIAIYFILKSGKNNQVRRYRRTSSLTDDEFRQVVAALTDHIISLDHELRFFTFKNKPINPKLEEISSNSRYVHIHTPIAAIENADPGSLIIVKGEPGSGKSVMLRDITKKLLEQISGQGKLPLYLNLADWEFEADLTKNQISCSIHEWIKSEFSHRVNPVLSHEADKIFDQAYNNGAFIFMFDAFDENQIISSDKHNGTHVSCVSEALAEYIHGSGGCIGLVFSRDYKSPNVGWITHRTFNVRPFSRKQVREYVLENCKHPESFIYEIEHERPDLFAMSSRPLLLALMIDFSNRNDGILPDTEFDIYDSFIRNRIERTVSDLKFESTITDKVYSFAKILSNEKQFDHFQDIEESDASNFLQVLVQSRIIKKSGRKVKFLHRRFKEYFQVVDIIENDKQPPDLTQNHILKNRDLIKLYVEVCQIEEASDFVERVDTLAKNAIDNYFTNEDKGQYALAILYLRLLRDFGRNKPDLIEPKFAALQPKIEQLWNKGDLICQKHALEFLSLVPPRTAAGMFHHALESGSGWLRRIALYEGRYVWRLQSWLGRRVISFLSNSSELDNIYFNKLYGINTTTLNADNLDRYLLVINITVRIFLLLACVVGAAIDDPLLGKSAIVLLLIFFILDSPKFLTDTTYFSCLNEIGVDRGLTGFISVNIIFGLLLNFAKFMFGADTRFLSYGTNIQLICSYSIILLTLALILNRRIIFMRDSESSLESLKLKSVHILNISNVKSFDFKEIVSRYIVLFIVFVYILALPLIPTPYTGWYALGLAAIFLVYLIFIPVMKFISIVYTRILEKRDKPQVIRFRKHFSGRRSEIEDALYLVKTYNARLDILMHAESVSNEMSDIFKSPENEWSCGCCPNLDDISLNSYLAMLDERWLGLS